MYIDDEEKQLGHDMWEGLLETLKSVLIFTISPPRTRTYVTHIKGSNSPVSECLPE